MLLTIMTTHAPATDLGFLLHKNPANLHSMDLGFGHAHVFYPEAEGASCTAALLLDLDPFTLRTWQKKSAVSGDSLFDYVNDRPYVASSFMSVALVKAFGTAIGGRSRERQALVDQPIDLEACLSVIHCRGGESIARRIFEPLGYQLEIEAHLFDPRLGLNRSNVFTLRLKARKTLKDLLGQLYVLVPVLNDQKHYAFGEDEVEKLLRHGSQRRSVHARAGSSSVRVRAACSEATLCMASKTSRSAATRAACSSGRTSYPAPHSGSPHSRRPY